MSTSGHRHPPTTTILGLLTVSVCLWAGAAAVLGTPLVPQVSVEATADDIARQPTLALVVCIASGAAIPVLSALIVVVQPADTTPDGRFSVRLSCAAIGVAATLNLAVGVRLVLAQSRDDRAVSHLSDTLVADRAVAYLLLALVLVTLAMSSTPERLSPRTGFLVVAAGCAIAVPSDLLVDPVTGPLAWIAVPSTAIVTALAANGPHRRHSYRPDP